MQDLFASVGPVCACGWLPSWAEVKAVCMCVFLFWCWIHRHSRIPVAPLSLVHVRLAKPPGPNIHLELSILAQTLSKLSIAEDDPQCSRTVGMSQWCLIQITPCWILALWHFLHIWRSSNNLACCYRMGNWCRYERKVGNNWPCVCSQQQPPVLWKLATRVTERLYQTQLVWISLGFRFIVQEKEIGLLLVVYISSQSSPWSALRADCDIIFCIIIVHWDFFVVFVLIIFTKIFLNEWNTS